MKRNSRKTFNLFFIFLIFAGFGFFAMHGVSYAATKTWTAASTGAWNTAGNWTPSGVPGSGDSVIFSASSTANCAIVANANAGTVTITSGYTGTITQGSGETVTVGTGGWTQSGGTFTGSSGGDTISIAGSFTLNTGATFTATTGDLLLDATTTFAGGTFQNNSGYVLFGSNGGNSTITGSTTFYYLQIGGHNAPAATVNIAAGTILTAQNYFYISEDSSDGTLAILGGEIDVQGNIGATSESVTDANVGTVLVKLTGTGTQTIGDTSACNAIFISACDFLTTPLPSLTIAKPSGGVTLENLIVVGGNFTNNGTAISPGTSYMVFGVNGGTPTITGSSTFNNVEFGFYNSPTSTVTIAPGTILTAEGYLYFDGAVSPVTVASGEIDVQGNVEDTENPVSVSSTVAVKLTGTGTQTIGDDTACAQEYNLACDSTATLVPSLTIAKPSGNVMLEGFVEIGGNFTNNGTSIDPGASTIVFWNYASTSTITNLITGSSTFNNLQFGLHPALVPQTISISAGTVLTTEGSFYVDVGDYPFLYPSINILGGEIDVQGNIGASNFDTAYDATDTTTVKLTGTGTQLVGDPSECADSFHVACDNNLVLFSNFTVAKPLGVAYLMNAAVFNGNVSVTNGEFQIATGTAATSLEINGNLTINSGAILSDYAQAASSLFLGSSVTNNGLVFFDGSGEGCTATLPDYVTINSTTTGSQISWSGSGNSIMRYIDVEDQGGSLPITVLNGTNNGDNNTNWIFTAGPEAQLVQNVAPSGGTAGTTQLALPAFSFKPRAGDLIVVPVSAYNQTIALPTDNAGNTYVLATSTTFGSSPSYALSLYYARNITPSSSLIVTLHGNGGSGSLLSGSAFEYTGIAPSSTFDNATENTVPSASTTNLTSFSATGQSPNELYFGAMTLTASTTAVSGAGWTPESGISNNTTNQALYVEDVASSSELTEAATWTAATSTDYAAIMGIFHAPYVLGYSASGTLDSTTFDTGVAGVQLNSFIWQGSTPSNSAVKFQFAVSNSPSGPWNFEGPDGTANTYFSGSAGAPVALLGNGQGYNLFNGYRYFRYRVTLFADSTFFYTPTVNQVTVNWSQ